MDQQACENRKSHPAEKVEQEVYNALRSVADSQEMLTQKITETFEQHRRELSRVASDTAPLIERLTELDQERKGYLRQNARGMLPDQELDTFLAELNEQRDALQESLESARNRDERLEDLDRQERRLLDIVSDGPSIPHNVLLSDGTDENSDGRHEVFSFYGLLVDDMWTVEERREIYKGLGLRIEVGPEGNIKVDGDLIPSKSVAPGTQVSMLWPPAAVTSRARFANPWPATSAKSSSVLVSSGAELCPFPEGLRRDHILAALQKIHGPTETLYAIDFYVANGGRFRGVLFWKHEPGEVFATGGFGHRERPPYSAQPAVQRQLTDHPSAPQALGWQHVGDGQNRQRYRQVEGRSLFAQVGRGQVHYDFLGRKLIATVGNSDPYPLPRLLHRRVRQPNYRKPR